MNEFEFLTFLKDPPQKMYFCNGLPYFRKSASLVFRKLDYGKMIAGYPDEYEKRAGHEIYYDSNENTEKLVKTVWVKRIAQLLKDKKDGEAREELKKYFKLYSELKFS